MAQLNIALPLEPLTSDRLAGFVEILEPVNALADRCPGFVWRLQTEDGDATAVRGFGDDRLIVDLTVWTSLEALGAYVHGGFHADVMRRREWVTHLREAYTALWWVPADVRPTVGDAELRLAALRERGPTPYAFTVKRPFAAPGSVVEQSSDDDWFCRA